MTTFSVARLPRIIFGRGTVAQLPDIVMRYGKTVLVVLGGKSFINTAAWERLCEALQKQSIKFHYCHISGEPSPQDVDQNVAKYAPYGIDCVVGVGGGSALDAGKAIAGLLKVSHPVMEYLEGVGPERVYKGPAVPFVAVPTTAGTGSEATKNAVLSRHGKDGFKKSFRDDKLVAEYAIIDPDLLASCPLEVIAANGMDALTQLIESYVSIKSNPFTDSLAAGGLSAVRDGLVPWYTDPSNSLAAREKMAYGALISGITLAQVGLGSVHGLASPLGAFFPIPHGAVCGTLLAEATRLNIHVMQEREPDNPALAKYAKVAEIVCNKHFKSTDEAWLSLVQQLTAWTENLRLPRLSHYGLAEEDLDRVVQHSRGSSMQTNPIVLSDAEIRTLLLARL